MIRVPVCVCTASATNRTATCVCVQYLVESIRNFPEAEALQERMEAAGFQSSSFSIMTAGVVAVHSGFKL